MDAQARKKALFRAKLNAHKKERRIDSPLARYNESDQLICRVCDVVLKSDTLWDAHQASRKHHEAISKLKANSAGAARGQSAKPVPRTELPKSKPESSSELLDIHEPSKEIPKPQNSSRLPSDFFDNKESKRQRTERDFDEQLDPVSYKTPVAPNHTRAKGPQHLETDIDGFAGGEILPAEDVTQISARVSSSEIEQVKGALPEGFFDNKDADLLARGIKPVKPDVKDEYKEFEKLIQDDLKEVDDRLEEEEIDAAEVIEEAESVEQKTYWEKLESLRKKKMELKVVRSVKQCKGADVSMQPKHEDSSSDDDSDGNFAVDWRAQHL